MKVLATQDENKYQLFEVINRFSEQIRTKYVTNTIPCQ